MKTITKKIDLYTFEELDQKAKDRARDEFNKENNDMPFLTDNLRVYIYEELKERGYTALGVSTSAKPSIRPLYSLSYSQGDGLMFEGDVQDKDGNIYTIKHSGHYYHERSTTISGVDTNGDEIDTTHFENNVYIPICIEVAKRGYQEIEYQNSEECMQSACDSNEYTFLKDGTMYNE